MATTQYAGTNRSFNSIVQGGAPDWEYYTVIRKVKAAGSCYPGNIVTGAGNTEGEVDLAVSTDGVVAVEGIVLKRVGIGGREQDIDTQITAGQYVQVLRPSGGRFIVAATRADQSLDTEMGEPMVLEATGHLKKFAYTDTAAATDTLSDCFCRCAEVTVDVASTDLVQLVYW